jgi:AcrR family transcriptional regulator
MTTSAEIIETRRPRQARAIRTRGRILDQAEVAFAAKGFGATSLTSDILEPAGVSVGSFYHQFSDKRAVLRALIEERRGAWHTHLLETVMSDEPTSLEDALRRGLGELFDDVERHPAWWRMHFHEVNSVDPEIRALFEREWVAWVRALVGLAARWTEGDHDADAGSVAFIATGYAGLIRAYLTADAARRAQLRGPGLDQTVRVCAASLAALR